MKFHRLTIRNLTTIVGEQTVDFDALFGVDSLLLIHGPTGSGKTTLLDAITLTLFDETARISDKEQNKRNQLELNELKLNDPRQLVTHGAEKASAELVFSVMQQGARRYFRAGWFVERVATRKASPPKWSDTRRLLVELDANGNDLPGGLKVTSTKAKDYEPAFKSVLGTLDSEQFRRSVLLAQGQFAALLHADAGERAKMLEGLTNTDAFGKIGERAADRHAAAKQEVERIRAEMQGASLWSDEAMAENLRLQSAQGALAEARGADLETAKQGAAWWSLLDAREHAVGEAVSARELAVHDNEALQPLRLWEARYRETEPLIPHYEEARRADDLAKAKDAEADALIAGIDSLQVAVTAAQGDTAAAQAATAASEAANRAILDELPRVQMLHAAAAQAQVAVEQAVTQAAEADSALRVASAKEAELASLVGAQRKRLESLTAASAAMEAWRNRTAELATLEQATADWKKLQSKRSEVNERQQARDLLDLSGAAAAQQASEEAKLAELEQRLAEATAAASASSERLAAATQSLADIARQRELLSALADIEQHRGLLQPGEACALCGSTEHPAASLPVSDRTRDLRAAAEEHERRLAEQGRRAEEHAEAARIRSQAEGGVSNQQRTVERARQNAAAALDRCNARASELGLPADRLAEALDAEKQAYDTASAAAGEALLAASGWLPDSALRSAAVDADARLHAVRDALHKASNAALEVGSVTELLRASERQQQEQSALVTAATLLVESRRAEQAAAELALRTAREQVAAKWGGRSPDAVASEAADAVASAAKQVTLKQERLQELQLRHNGAVTQQAQLRSDAEESRLRATTARRMLDAGLLAAGRSLEAFEADLRTPTERSDIAAKLATADERIRATTEAEAAALSALSLHRATSAPGGALDAAAAAEAVRLLDAEVQQARAEQARLKGAHDEAVRNRELQKGRRAALERAEEQLRAWKVVYDLIGGEKGALFRKAAQALNLERLIRAANIWLRDLNPRYTFRQSFHADGSPSLDFHLEDAHHANARRGVNAISGGETFLCSLALALGLASERGQTLSIETLLLDEGFGTLDADSLEEAIQTLEKLKSRHTSVGIISHVEGLRGRIQSQLEVRKVAPGRSQVTPLRCP